MKVDRFIVCVESNHRPKIYSGVYAEKDHNYLFKDVQGITLPNGFLLKVGVVVDVID